MSTVGLSLVLCSGLGTGIGAWIDHHWRTQPWGIALGFLFGTVAGFLEIYRTLMKANHDD